MKLIPQQAQMPGDAVVYGGVAAYWLGYLPTILGVAVSIVSLIWLSLQIWAWFDARRKR